MKKKVLGIGLALAMALSMGAMAAPSSFADQFAGDREQGPYGDNWRLPKEIGDDAKNWTSFTSWDGIWADISGNEGKTVVAAAYEVTSDGTAVIAPWEHAMNTPNYDNDPVTFDPVTIDVTVKILLNDEELYTYTGKDASAASEEITTDVKAGDVIYFVSTAPGATGEIMINYDTVSVDFTAAEGGEEPSDETPAEENPTTGEATTALPVMAAVVGLAALVLAKKAKKA